MYISTLSGRTVPTSESCVGVEVTFLQVADYANITKDDKLNVMGLFSNISVNAFPSVHPEMYLVAQLRASAAEYGRQIKLSVKLLNEDATEQLVGFEAPMTVPTGQRGQPMTMNITLRLVNTQFASPGTYEFSLLIDNDVKATLALDVNIVPPPSA